jgi:hypothetical protein
VQEGGQHDAALVALAQELRDVAVRAGRPDVAAKAQEAIGLIGRAETSADEKQDRQDTSNTVVRILDGLGF